MIFLSLYKLKAQILILPPQVESGVQGTINASVSCKP